MTHKIGNRRKFDGMYYIAKKSYKYKSDAKDYAEKKRDMGMKARVIKSKDPCGGNEYYIYTRK